MDASHAAQACEDKKMLCAVAAASQARGMSPLSVAIRDARALEFVLRTQHGFHTTLLLDSEATKTGIESALDETRMMLTDTACGSNCRFLLYFAGHGIQVSPRPFSSQVVLVGDCGNQSTLTITL